MIRACELHEFTNLANSLLLIGFFQPFGNLEVVKTDSLYFNAHFLVRCQIFSAVFLETKLIEGDLITTIKLLQEEFLEVWILALLLLNHLSSEFKLLLLLKELNHGH